MSNSRCGRLLNEKYTIHFAPLLPYTARHHTSQCPSYSISCTHTFTQYHSRFHDSTIQCGLTCATTKQPCIDSEHQKGHISEGYIQNKTVLAGHSASMNLELTPGDKNTGDSFRKPSEKSNGFVLRRRFSTFCPSSVIKDTFLYFRCSDCPRSLPLHLHEKTLRPFSPNCRSMIENVFPTGIRQLRKKKTPLRKTYRKFIAECTPSNRYLFAYHV
jgi:hypothetical protein